MLKMCDAIKILERNTPKRFRNDFWMADRGCFTVLVLYLDGLSIAIDKTEVEGKTDVEVEKLVKTRILTILREVIMEIDPDYFTSPG